MTQGSQSVFLAVSILPLNCQNSTSIPPKARRGRSILSSFFDGLKKIHKLVHEKKENVIKEDNNQEGEEDEDQDDVVVIKDSNNPCKIEFVVVESVHFALVGITVYFMLL